MLFCAFVIFAPSPDELFSQSESEEPTKAIVDDAAVFRAYPELKEQVSMEIEALRRDTGVTVRLITMAFLADGPPSKRARELATEWAPDRPAGALIYVRGSRSAGFGINAPLEQVIPAFELASLAPQPSDESSGGNENKDKDKDVATQLAESLRAFIAVARRHYSATGSSQGDNPSADSGSSAAPQLASTPGAKRWLFIAVLLSAAAIVAITAWTGRRHSASS